MKPVNRLESSSCGTTRAQEFIQSKPDESVLLALAAGAVVGVAIGVALGGKQTKLVSQSRRTAERLGERTMATLEKVLPESLSQSLGVK